MSKEFSTPGPRAIYPEIVGSRSLSRCGIVANALFPRLIATADDQGRLAGDAGEILGTTFPKMLDRVTVRQIATALAELERERMIQRYEVDDEPFVQILSWWQWQHNMRRAYPSRYPAPVGWSDVVYGFEDHPRTYREAGGLPPHVRKLPTSSPQVADTVSARSRLTADTMPTSSPHGAAPARAYAASRAPAVPDPTIPMPDQSDLPRRIEPLRARDGLRVIRS